jgi:DNA-binding NtrC family response regulator
MGNLKKYALIVDDDQSIRHAMIRELRSEFDSAVASSYAEALELLTQRQNLSVIIADCDLGSGPNGVELLKRAQILRPELPRILVSAFVEESTVADLIATEVIQAFLDKPWPTGALVNAARASTTGESDSIEEPHLRRRAAGAA